MSIIPPSGGGSQGDYARRRAAGTSRAIRWNKISTAQEEAVRTIFPRRQWRRVVNAIIDNLDHYSKTQQKADEHDYGMNIAQALGWTRERWEEFIEEYGDLADALGWYHPIVNYVPGAA